MSKKVAVVTGANSGIGYATVKGLCKEFDGDVVLTALSIDDANKAVTQLKSEGYDAKGVQLDQTDPASVAALRGFLEAMYGGVDALVCNAGVSYKAAVKLLGKENDTKVVPEAAKMVMDVNVFGTMSVLRALNSLMRPGSRIVVLSSRSTGYALRTGSDDLQTLFLDPNTQTPAVLECVKKYLEDVKAGDYEAKGWPSEVTYSYPLSKLALAKIAIHIQKEVDKEGRDILFNACCPGFVATQLTDFKGDSPEKGAETPIYLATLPAGAKEPRGKFVSDKEAVTLEKMLTSAPGPRPF